MQRQSCLLLLSMGLFQRWLPLSAQALGMDLCQHHHLPGHAGLAVLPPRLTVCPEPSGSYSNLGSMGVPKLVPTNSVLGASAVCGTSGGYSPGTCCLSLRLHHASATWGC